MLELYRFVSLDDVEDVALEDRSKYAEYDEGQWLSPVGNEADTWTMNVDETSNNIAVQPVTRLSKMLWMEKGRTDAKAVGKMTVIRGVGIRGKTDVFIDADKDNMFPGVELTLKVDTDGVVKLGVAASGDIVKALVYMSPGKDPEGLLHFELTA